MNRVAGDLHLLARVEFRAYLRGSARSRELAQHVGCNLEPQPLREVLPTRRHRLPEQQAGRSFETIDHGCREQSTPAHAPQPRRCVVSRRNPLQSPHQVVDPIVPARVAEVVGAVAATAIINLEDREAFAGEALGAERDHAARPVKLLRQRRGDDDRATNRDAGGWRAEQAVAIARISRQQERLRDHRIQDVALELSIDKAYETADRCKCGRVDLVVVDGEAEALLERGDDTDDGHRVELRHAAEQWSRGRERKSATAQAQRLIDDSDNFSRHVQAIFSRRAACAIVPAKFTGARGLRLAAIIDDGF